MKPIFCPVCHRPMVTCGGLHTEQERRASAREASAAAMAGELGMPLVIVAVLFWCAVAISVHSIGACALGGIALGGCWMWWRS
jgi:hypothetical protein